MPSIIGVKFRGAGKVYFFDPGEHTIRYNDHVIVETARGIEYGTVVLSTTELPEDKLPSPVKPIVRMATEEDTARNNENRAKEKEAYRVCKEKIAEHNLDMKLIEAEYTFDNSKVLFYFTADGRIDFRGLVKDLAGIFRTRIELRQIGVRDETKLLGGIGSCGRPLCCHTWLTEFAPVSIKMAKDQNLSLNPAKISGTCGRLMCCLKNEADTYAYLNKGLPVRGDYATTPDGHHGDVQSVNILRQTVKVVVELENDEKELQEFHISEITFIPKAKKPRRDKDAAQPAKKEENRPRDVRAEKYHDVVNEKLREASEAPEEYEQPPRKRRKERENGREENAARGQAPSRRESRSRSGSGKSRGEETGQEGRTKTADPERRGTQNRNQRQGQGTGQRQRQGQSADQGQSENAGQRQGQNRSMNQGQYQNQNRPEGNPEDKEARKPRRRRKRVSQEGAGRKPEAAGADSPS